MSGSDEIILSSESNHANVTEALRDALDAIGKQLMPNGTGPHGLLALTFTAPDPAAFHPSRHDVDLACREAFAGFVPPITTRKGEGGLKVTARARPLPKPSSDIIYGAYDAAALARQYSPRLQADFRTVCGEWGGRSAAYARHHRGVELRYGPGRFETLDLFYPKDVAHPPLWVFFHGGYWQAMDKNLHAHFADGMLCDGYAVAMVNYALAPQVTLETILEQCRAALHFLVKESADLDVDAARLHIAGHSAGGHIAAMLAADEKAPPIQSALLLSGVFDLEPLTLIPMNRVLGLKDPARIKALSPLYSTPRPGVRIGIAVGGAESDEFIRQSQIMADAWKTAPPLIVAEANHFTLLDGLNEGPLRALAQAIAS